MSSAHDRIPLPLHSDQRLPAAAALAVPAAVETFLAAANPAVISTTRRPNTPHSVATWYDWEDGRILVNMDGSRARLRWMVVGSRVSLTVLDRDDWNVHVTLEGHVAELRDDPDLVDIDRLSTRYGGGPYSVRDRKRVSAWIAVDSWHSWDSQSRRIATGQRSAAHRRNTRL